MLELCLILPVLLLLLVGTIELGRAAYFKIEVADAARAGALYAAQSMADAVDGNGILQAVQNNAQDLALTGANVSTPPLACVCPGSASVTTGSCPGGGCTNPQVYVTVNTTYSLSPLLQYPGLPTSFSLNGSSTMPVRQQ
jgi:Flp pilus assembly protein TadG